MASKAMTISFSVNHDDKYVVVKYAGHITDEELFDGFVEYHRRGEWFTALNQLSDFSEADTTDVTLSGVRNVAYYAERIRKQHDIALGKVATVVPNLHSFGLIRAYAGMTGNVPRQHHVFRNLKDAKDWLKT